MARDCAFGSPIFGRPLYISYSVPTAHNLRLLRYESAGSSVLSKPRIQNVDEEILTVEMIPSLLYRSNIDTYIKSVIRVPWD